MSWALYSTLLAAILTVALGDEMTSTQKRVYNYVIVVGVLALIAVLVPLHSILRSQKARKIYRSAAITSAIVGSSACFAGAAMGGVLWQSLPTGVFLLFLGATVGLRVVGGFDIVRKGVRLSQSSLTEKRRDQSIISSAYVHNGQWRSEMSEMEWESRAAGAGLSRGLLLLGGEKDQDAVAVGLLRKKLWEVGEDDSLTGMASPVELVDRHETRGVAILGLVPYGSRWMAPLLNLLAKDSSRRRRVAAFHHFAMFLWLAGMLCGTVAKTGWWPAEAPDHFVGPNILRVMGIWLESLLLFVAIFALPYSRGCVRLGARASGRLISIYIQATASVSIGVSLLVCGREEEVDGNNLAYAVALAAASVAAAAWSVLSVWAYGACVEMLLRGRADGEETAGNEVPLRAYLAALITRPRYGYLDSKPAARWGDVDQNGRAGLEVQLELESRRDLSLKSFEHMEIETELEESASAEWNMLERESRKKKIWK